MLVALTVTVSLILGFGFGSTALADPGPWLSPPTNLTPGSSQGEQPQIVVSADGTATAVWRKLGGPVGTIESATRPSGGVFGAPVDVSSPGPDSDQDALDPRVAVSPDGTVTVAWRVDGPGGGSTDGVYVATKPPRGSFGAPVALAEDMYRPDDVQLATGPDGTTTVAWRDRVAASPPEIPNALQRAWVATRPPGGSFGTPAIISEDLYINALDLAVGPDGTTAVALYDYDSPTASVRAVTRPPNGSFGAPTLLGSASGMSRPKVAVAADGSVSVIYFGALSSGSEAGFRLFTKPSSGNFGDAVEILVSEAMTNNNFQFGIAPDGSTNIVWREGPGSGSGPVWATTRQPGSDFSDAVQLSSSGHSADRIDLGFTPDSTMFVTWNEPNSLWAASRKPGEAFGEPLAAYTSDDGMSAPQLSVAADDSLNLAWDSNSRVYVGSTLRSSYLLQVNRAGDGSGSIGSGDGKIDCGSDCGESYMALTPVTLTATPADGSTFTGWSGGGCSGTGPCELTVKEAATVTAEFTKATPGGKAKLGALKITPKSKKLKAGKSQPIKVNLRNVGSATAAKVKVCVKAPKKLIKVKGCVAVGSLTAGTSKTIKFKVKLTKKAKVGQKVKLTFTATANGIAKRAGRTTLIRRR